MERVYNIDLFAAMRQMAYLSSCNGRLISSYTVDGNPLNGVEHRYIGNHDREYVITVRPDGRCTTNLDCFLQSRESYMADRADV